MAISTFEAHVRFKYKPVFYAVAILAVLFDSGRMMDWAAKTFVKVEVF